MTDQPASAAEQLMSAISTALKEGDLEAVVSLMKLLAIKNPVSAQLIYDAVRLVKETTP